MLLNVRQGQASQRWRASKTWNGDVGLSALCPLASTTMETPATGTQPTSYAPDSTTTLGPGINILVAELGFWTSPAEDKTLEGYICVYV
jgi:hypothetical protein